MLSSHPRFTLTSVLYPLVRPSGYPSVRISIRPDIRPYGYPSVRISVRTDIRPYGYPSVRISVRTDIRPYGYPSVRISVRPSVRIRVSPLPAGQYGEQLQICKNCFQVGGGGDYLASSHRHAHKRNTKRNT